MTRLRDPDGVDLAVGVVLVAALAAWEVRGIRKGPHGWTLSRMMRVACRTDTLVGRTAFTAAVQVGSSTLLAHILGGSPLLPPPPHLPTTGVEERA